MTRAELIAKGDAICYRLNAKRTNTTIARRQDYENLVPALAAYEAAGAEEMARLVPPRLMAHDWQQIVIGARIIAEVTGRYPTYQEAGNEKLVQKEDVRLGKGIDRMTHAAKRAGFKECSHFA